MAKLSKFFAITLLVIGISCVSKRKQENSKLTTNEKFEDSNSVRIDETKIGTEMICNLKAISKKWKYVKTDSSSYDLEGSDMYQKKFYFNDRSWIMYESSIQTFDNINRIATNSTRFVVPPSYRVGMVVQELNPNLVEAVSDLDVISFKIKNQNVYLNFDDSALQKIKNIPLDVSSIIAKIPNIKIVSLTIIPKCE